MTTGGGGGWAAREPGGRALYSSQKATTTTPTTWTTTTTEPSTPTGGNNITGFKSATPGGKTTTTTTTTTTTNNAGGFKPAPSYVTSNTASTQMQRDDNDMDAVTLRMVKMAVEANNIADETLKTLDTQNETIKKQQDEVAEMGDSLNVAERKVKGINSFFKHIGNQFKKDNSTEHQKARQHYEKERAKDNFKKEAIRQKMEEKELDSKIEIAKMERQLGSEKDSEQLKQANLQSHQEIKSARRNGGVVGGDGQVAMGKFVFEERETPGEQCEAENNLDEVAKHVKKLKEKATTMGEYVEESKQRVEDLHTELVDVQERTAVVIKKEDKIIKGW